MQDERDAAEFDEASYSVDFAAHCDGTPTSEPITSHQVRLEAQAEDIAGAGKSRAEDDRDNGR